jgi:hypothetical protein
MKVDGFSAVLIVLGTSMTAAAADVPIKVTVEELLKHPKKSNGVGKRFRFQFVVSKSAATA